MKTYIISAIKNIGKILAITLLYLGAWQLIAAIIGRSVLLPSPIETFLRLIELISLRETWIIVFSTIGRILAGFLMGGVAGIVLGIATKKSKLASWLLSPIRTIIKSTPVTSFVLVLLVLTASDAVPMIISSIMVSPILWASTETAIDSLDSGLREVGKIYLTRTKRFTMITLPQMLPVFLSAGTTAWGFAWKSAIAAEILALPINAIGTNMYFSQLYLNSIDLFAWTAIVVVLSLTSEQIMKAVLVRKTK